MNLVPKLRKEKKVVNIHQDVLIDEYAWIKQKDWQSVLKDPSKLNKEVLKYINEENNYKSEKLKNLKAFKKKLFEELKGRIKDKDSSVPVKDGKFSYYSKYIENSEYPQFLRFNIENNEEIIFDANIKSQNFKFFVVLIIYTIEVFPYSPKESSLKNSTSGPFGFECLSFTFCYLKFFLTPFDPCHLLWWVCGWGVFLL